LLINPGNGCHHPVVHIPSILGMGMADGSTPVSGGTAKEPLKVEVSAMEEDLFFSHGWSP
jgi:hypothetical protein